MRRPWPGAGGGLLPRPRRRRNGVSVGELADAACWSLQGRKTITAGEGGILTIPHREVYEKATLLGHFNKRALAEVRTESLLYRFTEAGFGLKYRAYPLGLAMAEVYLRCLDDWLRACQHHAARLENLLAGRASIGVLTPTGPDRTATFYALRVHYRPAGRRVLPRRFSPHPPAVRIRRNQHL